MEIKPEVAKNLTENYVHDLCRQSFLSLWSYLNPQGKNPGKELCDILVVCEPHIIIISVKAIQVTASGDVTVDTARWRRRAVEESVGQIYGAERLIKKAKRVIRQDGTFGLPFPDLNVRRVHRLAVAFGSHGKAPIEFGDFGKGYVHVFDEISLSIIMNELDTIMDFVSYLEAKENLYQSGIHTQLSGGEEDLLAVYLHNNRTFATNVDVISITNDTWKEFNNKQEYKAKKKSDIDSYIWDRIIEYFSENILHGNLEFSSEPSRGELALRTMAHENRFSRRIIGKTFKEFTELSKKNKIRSRMFVSPSGVVYVFLAVQRDEERKFRLKELEMRCFIARGHNIEHPSVIGLATEQYQPNKGSSFDIIYLHKPNWTADDQRVMEELKTELGYFLNPNQTSSHEDEYPS